MICWENSKGIFDSRKPSAHRQKVSAFQKSLAEFAARRRQRNEILLSEKPGGFFDRLKPSAHSWVYVRQYCAEIDEAARNRMKLIVRSLAEQNGVTEQLKAENQMEWVRQMNACKAQAEEIVKFELIYD